MLKNEYKEKFLGMPIEKHDTAAWANIDKTKAISNVPIPSTSQTRDAKDWVDSNQK